MNDTIEKNEKKSHTKLRSMIFTAIFAALLCVMAPFSIPIGAIPITLATFAVYLTGGMLGRRRAFVAVLIYLVIGFIGVPVFSGFRGGAGVVLGVTGGYLIGYLPAAYITGLFADLFKTKKYMLPVGMLAGTAVLYLLGTAWYVIATGSAVIPAISVCVVPFLLLDALKIIAASVLVVLLGKIRFAK